MSSAADQTGGSMIVRSTVLVLIVVTAACLRLVNINQGLWWDEIWSTMAYVQGCSWWYTISQLGFYFNNHPLYSIACRISIALFGNSELSIRLPSVLMGIAAIPVVYLLARPLTGPRPALMASFLLAVSTFHIDHSTEARGYSGMMLFALLSSLFFLKAVRDPRLRLWVLLALCTFLGFYCHAYMLQVPFVQVLCCLTLLAEQAVRKDGLRYMYAGAVKHLLAALSAAAIVTLAAYAPMLRFFVANAAKVELLEVDRLPFIADMYETVLPGLATVPGMLVYSSLSVCGLLYLRARSPLLLVYSIIICNVPLLLYLQMNPMFIFKRYFLPALPFCLLTLACGVEWIAGVCRFSQRARVVLYAALVCTIVLLQWPAIHQITTVNRQHYREAVAFVESREADGQTAVFAIGHAGAHFSYYADVPVIVPRTYAEFQSRVDSGAEIWCLISAWLPELRPAHEPELLYIEEPVHRMIFDYVTKNFRLEKHFRGMFNTYVYRKPAPDPANLQY
jgi:4-amino-4-deoxy-L-arabinose transferase-like glycosyltransferase